MNFIDTHSHIYLNEFSDDCSLVIERAKAAGVSHILLPNIDTNSVASMQKLCDDYPDCCYPMIGLHPTSVGESYKKEIAEIERLLSESNSYIAIGEVGLDLYWDKAYIKEQIIVFEKQINWALEHKLPLVIHCREAFQELCSVLLPYKGTSLSGVFHSFTGTVEEANKLLEFEHFKLGINGVVTFRNSILPKTLQQVPLDRIVLETDAPFLTPVPFRGKRNESGYLKYTLLKLADIYGVSPENLAEITTRNAIEVFSRLENKQRSF